MMWSGEGMRNRLSAMVAMAVIAGSAQATILTDESQLNGGNTLIDFEGLTAGGQSNPLTIGAATFSSSNVLNVWDISSYSANGTHVFHKTLRSASSTAPGYVDIRIDFATAMSEVGLGWFDPNFTGNKLRAFNSNTGFLEEAAIPTGPTGGRFAAFRGIRRSVDEIDYVICQVAASSDVFSIDNVSFGAHAPVPEPFTMALMGLGVAGAWRRRKRGA